jgi:hypothetical protein
MTSQALENPEYWEVTKHQPESSSQRALFKYPHNAPTSTSTPQCPAIPPFQNQMPSNLTSASAPWFE